MSVKRTITVLSLFALFVASGCGSAEVAEDEVEAKVKQALTEVVGQEPDSIDCPGGLAGKVGTTMRCTLIEGTTRFGVTVTVTSTDGDSAKFDAVVDDQPLTDSTAK